MIAKSAVFRIESFSCTGEQISLPAHISPSFIHSKLCGATVDDSGYRLQLGEHGECKISCIQCVIECNGQFQVYRGGDKGFCFRIEPLTQIILDQLPYRWFYEPRMIHSPIGMNLMLSHVALKALCDAETSQKLSEITHSAWTHRRHMSLLFRGAVGSGAEFVAMAIAGKYDMEVVRIQAHLLYQGATNCSVEKLLTQVLNLSFALCVPTIVIFEDIDALADNSTALQVWYIQ